MPAAIVWTEEKLALLPRSQVEAQRVKSRHYYPGTACPHGHVAPKTAAEGKCTICRRIDGAMRAANRRRTRGQALQVRATGPVAGETYYDLTATGESRYTQGPKRKVFEVQAVCTCGSELWLRGEAWGDHKRCRPCANRLIATRHGLSATILTPLYYAARGRARKKGIPFTIKMTDIVIPERCPILGITLDPERRGTLNRRARDNAPSIDRIDPRKGYTPDNIMVISYRANVLKNSALPEEIYKIAEFMRAREKLTT